MHLISLDDLDAKTIRNVTAGTVDSGISGPRLIAVLDFLPLGSSGLALRSAAARTGATLVFGRELFSSFPVGTDLLESARVAGAYADLVIVRHAMKGAARAVAAVSDAPVLSAGDGSGEDPLFALGDLAVLSDRIGGLEGKTVALCGDLLRNRRVHSLAGGLVASGVRVLLVPARGVEPGDGLLDRLGRRHGYHPVRFKARSMSSLLDMVDSWLLTPDLDHQLSLLPDVLASSDEERRAVRHQVKAVDAMWVAATCDETGEPLEPRANPLLPWRPEDGRAHLSEGLPVDEAPDWSERAPAEARVLSAVLRLCASSPEGGPFAADAYAAPEGMRCREPGCIARLEPDRVTPAFVLVRTDPVLLSCVYCWSRRRARYVGSRIEKRFHRLSSSQVKKILPRNTVFFGSLKEAESAGFVGSKI